MYVDSADKLWKAAHALRRQVDAVEQNTPPSAVDALMNQSEPRPPRNACCAPGETCGGIDRRQFMQAAAGLALPTALSGLPILGHADGGANQQAPPIRHFVPAEKNLSPDWLAALTLRGERRTWRGSELNLIGMPVGGIAAGQVYLCGDGTLGCWQIFNRDYFSGYGRDNYGPRMPERPIEQGFALVVDEGGQSRGFTLDRSGFPDVEFIGEYPIGLVRYPHGDCPASIELEAFSPFIPLNAADSALPATVMRFTIANKSDSPIRAAIVGWLANAVGFHSIPEYGIDALHTHRLLRGDDRTLALHAAEAKPTTGPTRPDVVLADFEDNDYGEWTAEGEAFGKGPAHGALPRQQPVSGFEGKGLVNTFLGGDGPVGTLTSPEFTIERDWLNFLIGGGNHPGETCMNLLIDGAVVRTATGRDNERLTWQSWDLREFAARRATLQIVDRHSGGWGHINVDQIVLSDRRRFGSAERFDDLEDFGTMALALAERGAPADELQTHMALLHRPGPAPHLDGDAKYPAAEKRTSAIAAPSDELQPGQQRTVTFVLTWHFPNRSQRGQMYANRFADAAAVADYVLDNLDRLAGETRRWHDSYYGGTLPHWLLERLHSTVANLATGTCQWWKNGRFWAWEGVGCCSGTCTHVWNYAHAPARLFPELERSVREMQDLGEALHDDGLVGFRGLPNGAYAADGQCGTILKCLREHQMSADDGFLRRNWAKIRRVLEYSIGRDGDDDGLIADRQHNTYDIDFHGPNTFVGSLYLAALRAGAVMARAMDDGDFAARLDRIADSGGRLSTERLWNGEYFIQQVDLAQHPKHQYGPGCLSDQLFGQGWAHQVGLGYLYPADKVHAALRAIWKYNWAPDIGPQNAAHKPERWFVAPGEAGLFTCTWPHSEHSEQGVRYRDEVWTGIEYQVAGHMIAEGMLTEGLAIVRGVDDRYHPARHNPFNEVECGDHYARALASWGVYLALCGFEYSGPEGRLGFAPRVTPEDFRCAFTTAAGWGMFTQKRAGGRQIGNIEVQWGELSVQTLIFAVPEHIRGATPSLAHNDQALNVQTHLEGERMTVQLSRRLTLRSGDRLTASFG